MTDTCRWVMRRPKKKILIYYTTIIWRGFCILMNMSLLGLNYNEKEHCLSFH
jgi:hypothetical protein